MKVHKGHGVVVVVGLLVSSIGHTEGGRASTILGLDNLIPAKLHPSSKSLKFLLWDLDRGLCLTEQRDDSLPGMSSHDRDDEVRGRDAPSDFGGECRGADDVEGGDAKEFLGVEHVLGFEDLSDDGDGRVDGVGDDEDKSLGAGGCDALGKVSYYPGVDLE
jgi:hypothetical protein